MNAWRRFGSLYAWEKPASFRNFYAIDFADDNPWTRARSLLLSDPVLRFVVLVQLCLMALSVYQVLQQGNNWLEGNAIAPEWVFGPLVMLQLGWALMARRTWCVLTPQAGRSFVREAGYVFRSWALLVPHALIPSWFIAGLLWVVMPIRLYTPFERWLTVCVIGRYWHYSAALVGATPGPLREKSVSISAMTVARRSDLFDASSERDFMRYSLPMGLFLVIGLIGAPVVAWVDSFSLAGHMVTVDLYGLIKLTAVVCTVSYAIAALVSSSIGMVWYPMVYAQYLENPKVRAEPELPAPSFTERVFFAPFMIGTAGSLALYVFRQFF